MSRTRTVPSPRRRPRFWETTALEDLSPRQWESLCDGCARCCLTKLQDAETGEVFYTDVACRLLDSVRCRCRAYGARHAQVPDCIPLDAATVRACAWLPSTCAYRLCAEGKPLPPWHPLVSGSRRSVHQAGASIRGKALSEVTLGRQPLEERIIDPNGW